MVIDNQIKINIADSLISKFPNLIQENNRVQVYTSPKEEYQALKNGVGIRLAELPVFIKMRNKDTVDFLHRVSTNDLKEIKPFQHKNTLFLNEKGRFVARANVIALDGEIWLMSDEDPSARLFSWINKYIIMEDIQTENFTGKFSQVELIGYQSESFLTLMIGDEINKISDSDFRRFDVDGFTFYLFFTNINGSKIYKIILDSQKLIHFVDHLFNIKSVFDLALVGERAFKQYRIENKIPAFPNEINNETNPHEVNLIGDVNFKKGCYIGQEVIARLDTYDKVQRKLVRFNLSKRLNGNSVVLDKDGNTAGIITSSHPADDGASSIALGLIRKKSSPGENGFYIQDGENRISVKILDKEF